LNVLGVIPARGGSKGIPRKNLALLTGRPLLAYTCEAALQSGRLNRVVLSTDDEEIAACGRDFGVAAPFVRPAELSRDETPIVEVLRHAVQWLEHNDGFRTDAVVLLQPTSPLRRAEHVNAALDLLEESGADTVVSVMEVPHQFTPDSLMRLSEDGRLVPFAPGPVILRRQDKARLYARNGPAVLVVRRSVLDRGEIYGDVVRPLVMSASDSVDIDDAEDLRLAEFWLEQRRRGS
jgi:CMP-N,N'-diacetyllegionaminic acid synthase